MFEPEISIVTETFNLDEGQGIEPTRQALFRLSELARARGNIEIILADPMPPNLLVASLLQQFPQVRHVNRPGLGYEGIKNVAAAEARGTYVVYLDSDCLPLSNGWLEALLRPLRAGQAQAATGLTRYRGDTVLHRVMEILDFGFVLADPVETVGCYTSNNCAFVRHLRVELPAPDGAMRCTCYAHAQLLLRRGFPMRRVPEAVVEHELPPVFNERWRRGYDLVAACWVNPALPETRWLRLGVLATPLFFWSNLRIDWHRLGYVRSANGWSAGGLMSARVLAGVLRLIDLAGIFRALSLGPARHWAAYGEQQTGQNLANRPDSA
jgi:glycosyltransferase involved in cell wall biosynthesis